MYKTAGVEYQFVTLKLKYSPGIHSNNNGIHVDQFIHRKERERKKKKNRIK